MVLIIAYDDIVNNALFRNCQEINKHKQNYGNSQALHEQFIHLINNINQQ